MHEGESEDCKCRIDGVWDLIDTIYFMRWVEVGLTQLLSTGSGKFVRVSCLALGNFNGLLCFLSRGDFVSFASFFSEPSFLSQFGTEDKSPIG